MNEQQRFAGIVRNYSQEDVRKLRGPYDIKYSLAEMGSKKLWDLLHEDEPVRALGALTGNMAVQQVRAGLKAIYLSGWQVAADANTAGQMYPDQSLYPVDSVPSVVKKINAALLRTAQIESVDGHTSRDWLAPIVADAEAGFGGPLNAFELMKSMIEAGAAGVHFEDQLASAKKCGHMGGKVLIPTNQFVRTLLAARLAADVCDVPTVLVARTDADSAKLLTSDIDDYDQPFVDYSAGRTVEGYYHLKGTGMQRCIVRGLAYAPYADMLWMETSTPDIQQAKEFADAIHREYPGKLLAYNCSPSFNWAKNLDPREIGRFQEELGKMGYRFQFVTLAGFHTLNLSMFKLAHMYNLCDMTAYSDFQQEEFRYEETGYTATKHQHEVGTGYFDRVTEVISGGESSTMALEGSTEKEQF
jgi:isocitrate lyase